MDFLHLKICSVSPCCRKLLSTLSLFLSLVKFEFSSLVSNVSPLPSPAAPAGCAHPPRVCLYVVDPLAVIVDRRTDGRAAGAQRHRRGGQTSRGTAATATDGSSPVICLEQWQSASQSVAVISSKSSLSYLQQSDCPPSSLNLIPLNCKGSR